MAVVGMFAQSQILIHWELTSEKHKTIGICQAGGCECELEKGAGLGLGDAYIHVLSDSPNSQKGRLLNARLRYG